MKPTWPPVAIMAVTLLLGSGSSQAAHNSTRASPSAAAALSGVTAATSPSSRASARPASAAHPSAGAGAARQTAAAPPAPGQVNEPRLGKYLYDLSGTHQAPGAPASQPYPSGTTLTVNVQSKTATATGDEFAAETTTSQDPGVFEDSRVRWEMSRIALYHTEISFTGLADYNCDYTPPLELLPIPVRSGALPAQQWSSSSCSGTAQITVVDQEPVTAAGVTWPTWKITSHVTYQYHSGTSTLSGSLDETTWFAPGLGESVKSDTTGSSTLNGQAASTHQVTVLRSYPA